MRLSLLVYLELNKDKQDRLIMAEVGVYKGDNALEMLNSCSKIDRLCLIDSFTPEDRWFTDSGGQPFLAEAAEQWYANVKERFSQYNGKVQLVRKLSVEAAKDYPDQYFDYVYIDGGHDYEIVREDIKAWYPKVKIGGMLAGHDCMYPDVVQAFIEYSVLRKIPIFTVSSIKHNQTLPELSNFEDWWLIRQV